MSVAFLVSNNFCYNYLHNVVFAGNHQFSHLLTDLENSLRVENAKQVVRIYKIG